MLLHTMMKHGGTSMPAAPPQLEGAGIVTVEGLAARSRARRECSGGSSEAAFPSALLRHLLADVVPQVSERRHLAARDVVGDRHPGQLHDAALDGVHEREVAHRPGEECFPPRSRTRGGRRESRRDRSRARCRACAAPSPDPRSTPARPPCSSPPRCDRRPSGGLPRPPRTASRGSSDGPRR